MSIINQMLKDLEARRAQGFIDDNGLLSDTGISGGHSLARPKKMLLIAVLLLMSAVIVLLVWDKFSTAAEPIPIANNKTSSIPEIRPLPVLGITVSEDDEQSVKEEIVVAAATVVTVPEVEAALEPVTVFVAEAKEIVPTIESIQPTELKASGRQQALIINGKGFIEPLRVTLEWRAGRYFKELDSEQVQVISDAQIRIHFNPGTSADNWTVNVARDQLGSSALFPFSVSVAQELPKKAVVNHEQEVVAAKTEGSFSKKVREQSLSQQAQAVFMKASALLQQGNMADAEQAFRRALQLDTRQHKARELLAGILFRSQRISEATRLLDLGRLLQADYIPYTLLYARMLAEQGNLTEAIMALESLRPSLPRNENYYALLAALYQRVGNHKAASQAYKNLLAIKPNQSIWWMGLGISLQALNQSSDALAAFRRAQTRDLSPALQKFVSGRIRSLR